MEVVGFFWICQVVEFHALLEVVNVVDASWQVAHVLKHLLVSVRPRRVTIDVLWDVLNGVEYGV